LLTLEYPTAFSWTAASSFIWTVRMFNLFAARNKQIDLWSIWLRPRRNIRRFFRAKSKRFPFHGRFSPRCTWCPICIPIMRC
jgi:hypothetical protein